MRTRPHFPSVVAGALLVLPGLIQAQLLPQLHLRGPRLSIGGEAIELHRVRGAGFLSNGDIVIGDGGNTRVLVVSPAGQVIRSIGRPGAGPGDFRMLWRLAVIRDTILTYDTGLQRVSLWTPDGKVVRSHSLVRPGRSLVLRAFASPSEFIVTARSAQGEGQPGLLTDTVSVLRLFPEPDTTAPIATRAWEQLYLHRRPNATTTYVTPFLGQALVAAAADRVITIGLAASQVEILRRDGSASPPMQLPVNARPFDRSLIEAYRDSLIRLAQRSSSSAPGAAEARRATEDRLREVFGSGFPLPARRPFIEAAHTVGEEVWLRTYPVNSEVTTWFVLDAARERLAGRLVLPAGWQVLGGTGQRVLVLQRDDLGVESVVVYDVERIGR